MPDQRPAGTCLTHRTPEGRNWVMAPRGYQCCDTCLDTIRANLADITRRYLTLNPRPGANTDHGTRGAPGYSSRSPASDHVITMRDHRSKCSPVVTVWEGADGREHTEQDHPTRSIPAALSSLAAMVAEERDMTPPATMQVPELGRWLDSQLDYVTKQEYVAEFADELWDLLAQLKPLTGDPGRKHIFKCPAVIDEGEHTRECGALVYPPARGDTIRCPNYVACRGEWPRPEWERLGKILQAATTAA